MEEMGDYGRPGDPWVVNKHEKQSVFHLKAEWCSGLSLWGKIGETGHQKNNEIIRYGLQLRMNDAVT